MDRREFHKLFKVAVGPAVLPVIHVLEEAQTTRNVRLALQEGAQGVFLINHDFHYRQLLPIISKVRETFPSLWLGVNFLGVSGAAAFSVLGELASKGTMVDAYWADNARIDEHVGLTDQKAAIGIQLERERSNWKGLYFGGTAFKKQQLVGDKDVGVAAFLASHFMDVITTSGQATGVAAAVEKIKAMRAGCGEAAMALASGVTPSNALDYTPYVDCFLVVTGISISGDFYNFDPTRLRSLLQITRSQSPSLALATPSNPWYLNLIAANMKGEKFAWLDPSSIYSDGKAF